MNSDQLYSPESGNIEGSIKDPQSITSDWQKVQHLITDVTAKNISNVVKDNGHLTEIFRQEWFNKPIKIEQIFQVALNSGEISGWHSHKKTEDHLFVSVGTMKIVLFDARTNSPTFNIVNEFRCGSLNPMLIVVPAGVWHAIENISEEKSSIINFTDHAYQYNDPDHWRLPINTERIPYSFNNRIQNRNF